MIDLIINHINYSLFFLHFQPQVELSVEKKSWKSCSSLSVYLLYEVVFLMHLNILRLSLILLSKNNHAL